MSTTLPVTPPEHRGQLIVHEYTLQLISVFSAEPSEIARIAAASEWKPLRVDHKATREFLIDQYTPEFRNTMFLDESDEPAIRRFERTWKDEEPRANFDLVLKSYPGRPVDPPIPFRLHRARVFAFEGALGNLGLFVIDVRHRGSPVRLSDLSALGNGLRIFTSDLRPAGGGKELTVKDLIQEHVLPAIEVRDDAVVNAYSGSKLKTFLAVDLGQTEHPDVVRDLLYDLGCFTPVGSAHGDTPFTPSDEYLKSIVAQGVRPFRNYQALTLLDSFVAVGSNLLRQPYQRATWDDTYLRIYVYNLYVKFRCQQLMADLHRTASREREQCRRFMVSFDVSRISYNFLPSLIHEDMRRGLQIKEEIEALRKHVEGLSKLIDEDYQKRTAALLGTVSVLGALQGAPTYLAYVPRVQAIVHLHGAAFWLLAAILLTLGAGFLGAFLFPDRWRQVRRRYSRRKAGRPPEAVVGDSHAAAEVKPKAN